jgi:hypothetical protein
MSIETALRPWWKGIDPRKAANDPQAAMAVVFLIHHIDDLQEALDDDDIDAARASLRDIHGFIDDLDHRDLDRIEVVFKDTERYDRFVNDLSKASNMRL